ncbi:MAG: PIG-L family deacetylase [Acidimicrobiales bacterium]
MADMRHANRDETQVRVPEVLRPLRLLLAVVAHPDDESFGLGGVLAALAATGRRVSLLCFTAGEGSTLGASPELARITRSEVWPDEDHHGLPVLLAGGEVGVLTAWRHSDDHSWWQWSVEFSNHTGRPADWAPPGQESQTLSGQVDQEQP